MSERSGRLFKALSEISDEKIERAAPVEKKVIHWKRWSVFAAVLALAVGAGSLWWLWLGGSSGPGSGAGAGGGGHEDGSTVFMSYAGPVFPLTLREAVQGLTAARQVTLDFAPWVPEWYPEEGDWRSSTDILVEDTYTLCNESQEDQTVLVLYPFVSSLRDLYRDVPELQMEDGTLESRPLEGNLYAGGYSGGFQTADASQEGALLNLAQLESWEQYRALLSDGRYQAAALEAWPELSDVPVIVYKFTDYQGPEPDEEAGIPNPSIRAGFDLDYSRTTVLSYGFHGASYDRKAGTMIQEFSIPRPSNRRYGEPYYLFVVGEDIRNLTTGGYVTGGTDADTEPLEGCRVKVERYESDLDSALREAAELMYGLTDGNDHPKDERPDFEMYFGLLKEFLVSYGPLSGQGPERYDMVWLEWMDFDVVKRVFYLEAEVVIPAGESVTLTASLRREGSYDFYCAGTKNRGIYGYDLVTGLGSCLDFTSQTAVLRDRGQIEIVRQNFGFDLEKGVREVLLDRAVEHYYLEVRGREKPEDANPGKMQK